MSIPCRKCARLIPDESAYCLFCGAPQAAPARAQRVKHRGNGQGSAYPRGKTWTACVTLGYRWITLPDGSEKRVADRPTKGGFRTKKEALAYCEELKKRGKKRPVALLSFIDLYAAWEEGYQNTITKSTLNCYRAAKKYFRDLWHVPFADLEIDDLQSCIDECPHGRRTRENMKALASLMYQYAVPRHQAEMNYAEYLDPRGGESGTYPAFSPAQVALIRSSVPLVPHADMVLALIYTGFRPTELFSLRASDVYQDSAGLYLEGGIKTAAGKGRAVTVSPKILPIIQARLSCASPYLFPRDDGVQLSAKYFREMYFYPALQQMGIQPLPKPGEKPVFVPYSCRHTFSNFLKDAVGSDKDKASLIGHQDYETTKKKYQSSDLAHLRAITDQF